MIGLTFDSDHLTDSSLEIFNNNFLAHVPGDTTFFLHRRFNTGFPIGTELCPHPLLRNLDNATTSIVESEEFVPTKAYGIRPHSCVYFHLIGIELGHRGYNWISQATYPNSIDLRPFRHPWGLWELPIYYMDNMDFWMPKNWDLLYHNVFDSQIIYNAINNPSSLFIFDFHPLHILLNTSTHTQYASVKHKILDDGICPSQLTFPGSGTRDFFFALCKLMTSSNQQSYTCSNLLDHFSTKT